MERFVDNPSRSVVSSNLPVEADQKDGSRRWGNLAGFDANKNASTYASLFSSSLPLLPHDASTSMKKLDHDTEGRDCMYDVYIRQVGNSLPDDEEDLLAGIMDGLEPITLPRKAEELDEYDVFGSGGGMELDSDPIEGITAGMTKASIADCYAGNGANQHNFPNGVGTVAGEHPYGEHPSRTLFVRNINSNVEDSELRDLFQEYGDIRTLYTATKHRGFVMISYYDIRSARNAMRALQNKPLRRKKLDIHFSIPKDNPSEKDINQGTLVIFNLDPSVSNDEIREIFGAYGEVKEIRETPNKRHHRFIEFYDVRNAEAALRSLNKTQIGSKQIKLEHSRPGGARRNLMQQLSNEFEQDEMRTYRHHVGSPAFNSPPGTWAQFGSPAGSNLLRELSKSPSGGAVNLIGTNHLSGIASPPPPLKSNSLPTDSNLPRVLSKSPSGVAIIPIGTNHLSGLASVPPSLKPNSPKIAPIGKATRASHVDQVGRITSSSPSYGPSTSSAPGIGTLSGPQFLWGSQNAFSSWRGNSFFPNNHAQIQGSYPIRHHHVGSAPSVFPLESHLGPCTNSNPAISLSRIFSAANFRMTPSQRCGQTYSATIPYLGPSSMAADGFVSRGRNNHVDNIENQTDIKEMCQLNLEKIISGEDTRTTLMIKNIPNKYTSKMLLAVIDEYHAGTYDFFYLPIDFKNKCNVGYAFINMVSSAHVISFCEAFNGKKWEKFNSEKVVSLAYARIQGRAALISHFQNSSLMNEDNRCRPILFHSKGPEDVSQEPFPSNGINIRMLYQDPIEKPKTSSPLGVSLDEKKIFTKQDWDNADSSLGNQVYKTE
ncbi:protein MEI2-like 2 isoform X2 [Ananas comosus]|uniref:Protein MEI2-like 2 isoform X2 n=1 Tax=Ananas comosus TaxID=4615 RepID=A0A6P5F051_ANACO|nr:protein MEI2-like 2 isoform X2 [Ananas comosus]XP_020089118.1 protein MEI2-like 2 isoform X2 [Ananas comosus]